MGVSDTAQIAEARTVDRGVARKQAFLEAARAVFLEYGYEAASVNEVVRRAGGSLATLYAQYHNKEGLFLAVAQHMHESFYRDVFAEHAMSLPLREGLNVLGEQFIKTILQPDHINFYRIMAGEGRKFPELLQRYFSSGAQRMRDAVAAFLARASADEGAVIPDPNAAAAYLFDLWRSRYQYRALSDVSFTPTDEELVQHVRAANEFFLNGALPR